MLHPLHNDFWQTGILPQTGASVAYGRVRIGDQWRDTLRPTPETEYGNSSRCASFIMMPWCNRIRDGILRFAGADYPLRTERDDGTARHGDVRKRPWRVIEADAQHIRLRFTSTEHAGVNFPFRFTGEAEYRLEDRDFVWILTLRNDDDSRMPAGFGHHPYFVREPQAVEIPCEARFELVDFLAEAPPIPVTPPYNFMKARPLGDLPFNDLFTHRKQAAPARLVYDTYEVQMTADPAYQHLLLFCPPGEPSVALEPMTNANDGFNLYARSIEGSGVFVLAPGASASAAMRLTLVN